ncbi:hypothetical protein BOTBODRAFT_91807, partial [Botryobasidium botryosum FD-172 SS1]
MPPHNVSDDLKRQAVHLFLGGLPRAEVATLMGVKIRSLFNWAKLVRDTGDVVTKATVPRGRPRVLTTAILHHLADLLKAYPTLYIDEILQWLAIYHDTPISLTQLCRNLHDANLTYKVVQRAPLERDAEDQLVWKKMIMSKYRASQL